MLLICSVATARAKAITATSNKTEVIYICVYIYVKNPNQINKQDTKKLVFCLGFFHKHRKRKAYQQSNNKEKKIRS